jgi:DNA-binding MarR family transcriptional regulator
MSDDYYESALLRLRRITAYFNTRYEDAIRSDNISPVQFEILLYVDSSSPCSISDVAQFMVVDKSTSSRVLRGIEERGLITVEFDEVDRRRRRIFLTEDGQALVDTCKKQWLDIEKDVMKKYDEAIERLETL